MDRHGDPQSICFLCSQSGLHLLYSCVGGDTPQPKWSFTLKAPPKIPVLKIHSLPTIHRYYYFGYFIKHTCSFFNDTATTEIYTLSLHDALPISCTFHTLVDM